MIATMNNIGTMFGYLYRKIARPVATHCKKKQKTWDDIVKIASTVEIYNRSMVQNHPVLITFIWIWNNLFVDMVNLRSIDNFEV